MTYAKIENIKIIVTVVLLLLNIFAISLYFITEKIMKREKMSSLKITEKEKATGIIFGKTKMGKVVFSPCDSEGHISVFGGSGLGKTSAILIPTLRTWKGTSFTVDISGDICKNVKMPLKLIYNPEDKTSSPYNVFGAIDEERDIDIKNEMLEQLAFLIMPDELESSETGKFFNTEGRNMLIGSLICYYHVGMDFIEICEKIIENNWRDLLNDIADHDNRKANQYIASFAGANDQNNAGCKQSMDKAIKLFATNEKVKKTIRRPKTKELCYMPRMLEKYNVFIVIDDSKLEVYSPLLQLITAQTLQYLSARSNQAKQTILLTLDEFVSLGKLEITAALRKLRKKHVRIIMLTQSMADIDLVYGRPERMAMMNNYKFKVVLGCDDTDTQEYFAKLIGQKESVKRSVSKSTNNTTQTEAEQKEWVVPPADLARLGDELILLSPDGYKRLKKNFYYK